MQIHKSVLLLVFLAALLPLGCDQTPTGVDDDIASFVESEPLSEAQEPELVFESSEWGIEVFWVSFGEARDCPSGCFYSKAYGLKFQDRIGWMGLDAYGRDDSVTTRVNYFDVQAGDSILFKNEVRNQHHHSLEVSLKYLANRIGSKYASIFRQSATTLASTERMPICFWDLLSSQLWKSSGYRWCVLTKSVRPG